MGGRRAVLKYMLLALNFSNKCAEIGAQLQLQNQKSFTILKMFLYLETKWHFGTKSAVFKCKNFLNAYFSSNISGFSAGIRLSRTADGGKRSALTFHF